jgi:hypothetical protein
MTGIHLLYTHKYLPPSIKQFGEDFIKTEVLINLFATLFLPATYHSRRIGQKQRCRSAGDFVSLITFYAQKMNFGATTRNSSTAHRTYFIFTRHLSNKFADQNNVTRRQNGLDTCREVDSSLY